MPNAELLAALTGGDQASAGKLIATMDDPGTVKIDDLSGNGRRYHLVHIAAFTVKSLS